MEKMTITEFKKGTNIDIIKELMKQNKGYITAKLITELGIHRMYLSIMEERKIIRKVGHGIYVSYEKTDLDDFYIFCLENPKAILSDLTALYLHGIFDKEPEKYDITVPHKYHNRSNNVHNVHYITYKFYNLGIVKIKSPKNNYINVYDVHKSICDIIRFKIEEDIILDCMKKYIEKYDNYNKLIKYAEILKVKERVIKFYQEAGGIIEKD